MVMFITPAIMLIRLERIIQNITEDKQEVAIRLCQKYVRDISNKPMSIITRDEAKQIAQELFEIELLITLGIMDSAVEQLNDIRNKVVKTLSQFHMFRNRLMNEDSNIDSVGSLAGLPNNVLHIVADKLQFEYVW